MPSTGWTLVTGAAKGLGAAIAMRLASQGFPLLLHYHRSRNEAERVAERCRALGGEAELLQADFSDRVQLAELLEEVNRRNYSVAHLINNVGSFSQGSALNTPSSVWMDLFQTNFHAPLALIQGLIPQIKRHRGAILNIGSVGAMDAKADLVHTCYGITKKALYLLTKSLAKELAAEGVRVNMVSPGELENSVTLKENFEKLPMHRPGRLEEVAAVVAFLLQEENTYLTGQNIEVAGGFAL